MDPSAFNYNSAANTDDGSCEPILEGCSDSTKFNYDPAVNVEMNIMCYDIVYGCM